MKIRRYFDKDELKKTLGILGYRLISFPIKFWDEDEGEIIERFSFFTTIEDEIKEINMSEFLGTQLTIELVNGEKIKIYSDNINGEDAKLIRYKHNQIFSPIFKENIQIPWTKDLEEWLWFQDIEELTIYEDNVYEIYKYKNIGIPLIDGNDNVYGIQHGDFELSEKELMDSLNEISNKEMARNIQYILENLSS